MYLLIVGESSVDGVPLGRAVTRNWFRVSCLMWFYRRIVGGGLKVTVIFTFTKIRLHSNITECTIN